ncbi:MAG: NADPH-dependent 7-cyano-7-deazaguanine reductase QueF [Pseudomonadales bacterium]|nr:NADPH-dependent 7-cyano-7-deazaguanine reductase QueF [Pseudomonadales bacterium]MCP5357229.1 NADPH-dependent 7-cyano-7-deazaguanine reductase QueF [Pseudomonadales bacterium]
MSEMPLGRNTSYPKTYNPEVLFPIPRIDNRRRLGVHSEVLPFRGYDLWRAYEVSWLDLRGKPVVMLAEFMVPVHSPYMVESKSFKLYLNSFNQTRFANPDDVRERLVSDLSGVAGAEVLVQLSSLSSVEEFGISLPQGESLDVLEIDIDCYQPDPALLRADAATVVEETLYSDLFKSNCPVTGQPDWGTVVLRYHGPRIDHAGLLRYLISFRDHEGFHEDCTEQIFCDLMARCRPINLGITLHFLRRGGLEIVPVRSTEPALLDFPAARLIRQ